MTLSLRFMDSKVTPLAGLFGRAQGISTFRPFLPLHIVHPPHVSTLHVFFLLAFLSKERPRWRSFHIFNDTPFLPPCPWTIPHSEARSLLVVFALEEAHNIVVFFTVCVVEIKQVLLLEVLAGG